MSKADDLARQLGANIQESMGAGRTRADAPHEAPSPRHQGLAKVKNVAEVPVDMVVADPNQPRKEFNQESLLKLASSLLDKGQLQPIRVTWDEALEKYAVLVGERRLRAARLANLPTIAAILHEGGLGPDARLALQLVENAQREDLKPVEQARAYQALMDHHDWSATRVAHEVGVSQGQVSRSLKLLGLPEAIQAQVDGGSLPAASAYEIAHLGPEDQEDAAHEVAAGNVRRDDLRDRRQGNRKLVLQGKGGTVTIVGAAVKAGPKAIKALLREALAQVPA